MKSFSEIRNKLKDYGYLGETHVPSQDTDKVEDLQEEWGVGVQPYPAADTVDHGNLLNLEDESTFNQLNAFVGSIAHRDYIDPKVAVHNLRNKLQTIGLNFDVDESSLYGNKILEMPLYRFGTVTGWSKQLDGKFVSNLKAVDEDSHTSYFLEMNFQRLINGLTSITAEVKKMNADHGSVC
jgi:hypothetical protein